MAAKAPQAALHAVGPPVDACGVCGGAGRPWTEKDGYPILRCGACGNGFVPARCIPEDLESIYSEHYFEGSAPTGYPSYRADARLILRSFEKRLAWIERLHPPGRLLDVGAAYGYLLQCASRRGWDAMGVELAADVVARASRQPDVRVVAGSFLEAPLSGPFDVVTFFDVFEHMRDPLASIEHARELLAPGGLLVIETGDADAPWARLLGRRWYFLDPPQHLFYFTHRGLEHALRRGGFGAELHEARFGRWVSFSNAAFKLGKRVRPDFARRAILDLARRGLPGALYLNPRDCVTIAARR